jgi:hypothetical protein
MNRSTFAIALAILALVAGGREAAAQIDGELPAKPPGIVRIGIVKPQLQMGSEDSPDAAESVRLMVAEYLQGPTIEVALLGARLSSQYAIEAAQADCDFVLALSLTHQRGRMNEALGRTLGNLASRTPIIPSSDVVSAVVLSGVLSSVADFAANIRARDQLELGYELGAVGTGQPVLQDSIKRRAKSDGEDLLTPLVEAVAEAVGVAVVSP